MSSGLLQVFVELGNLHRTSNYVLYWIGKGRLFWFKCLVFLYCYSAAVNKGRSSKFHEGSQIRQTPEEGRRTYRPKRSRNNNKDEDNNPKTLNDKKESDTKTTKSHPQDTYNLKLPQQNE